MRTASQGFRAGQPRSGADAGGSAGAGVGGGGHLAWATAALLVPWLLLAGGCSDAPPLLDKLPGAGSDSAAPGLEQAAAEAADRGQTLDAIRARGALRVVTRNAPTTWYLDRHDEPAGPEFDLASAFAESLGVGLEVLVRDTLAQVLDALDEGEADLAAAGLTATDSRSGTYLFGPAYKTISEQVVCHRSGARVKRVADLEDVGLVVAERSSYVETLNELAAASPDLRFQVDARDTEQLLAAVADGQIDCTVADSHIVALNRRYYPVLKPQFALSKDEQLVWMMAEGASQLQAALVDWFLGEQAQLRRREVDERYYALSTIFDFVELRAFQRRLRERYPRYRELFEAAAGEHGLDSELLAAQAYQESGWDPKAKSPTGVRGMMMLTQPTARAMGVSNRLDAAQSIAGGARYLARMRDRFDDSTPEPDRTYLALAAYNIGRGHLHDAQSLARERGLDPLVWQDVKSVLPLLADKNVYPTLKYGYARGTEPVRYVERIRSYEDILRQSLANGRASPGS